MFIKCLDGTSYININQVFGLFVDTDSENVANPHYYIKAGINADCSVRYLLEVFDSKAEAEAALEGVVANLNRKDQPVQNVVTTGECTIHKKLHQTKDEIIAAARVGKYVPPHKLKPTQLLAGQLHDLVNDFASSGDTDYLLRANAYIRSYLEQEAKNE